MPKEYVIIIGVIIVTTVTAGVVALVQPTPETTYNYSYGVDKETGEILYYHIGTTLENGNSQYLDRDIDYDSTQDTSRIDWKPDTQKKGPCLNENGFNGADDNDCNTQASGVYDKGVIPKEQ